MTAESPLRERLLQAGFKMLKEKTLGEIRLLDLTRAVGTSNGAFYHSWPDGLAGFVRDLTAYALDQAHSAYLTALVSELGQSSPDDMPLREIVRRLGKRDSEGIDEAPAFRAQVALWPEAQRNQSVHDELKRQYERFAQTMYIPTYAEVLNSYGLEMRPPFTVETLATALTALAEGLALRRAVDPDGVKPPDPLDNEGWDLFGALGYALLGVVARPREGSDMRTVFELADELLNSALENDALEKRTQDMRTYRTDMSEAVGIIDIQLARLRALHTKATGVAAGEPE
jgi:AcrR family transcriptional regulator